MYVESLKSFAKHNKTDKHTSFMNVVCVHHFCHFFKYFLHLLQKKSEQIDQKQSILTTNHPILMTQGKTFEETQFISKFFPFLQKKLTQFLQFATHCAILSKKSNPLNMPPAASLPTYPPRSKTNVCKTIIKYILFHKLIN